MQILIVDDEKDVRESLCSVLEAAGYKVATAASGAEAIESLKGQPVNLMLVDLSMPGMSGEELITKLKKTEQNPQMLVITALAPWQTSWLLGQGIGYLRKPVDAGLLLTTVGTLMRKGDCYANEKTC